MSIKSTLFIISFLNLALLYVNGQELSVDQTLSYINKQLNEPFNRVKNIKIHTFVPEGSVNTSNVDRVFMDDYKYQIKIENGYLVVLRTFSKRYTTKNFNSKTGFYETAVYTPIIEEQSIALNEIENILE